MRASWADANARARGLGTHLMPVERLRQLAGVRSLAILAAEFARGEYPVDGQAAQSIVELDRLIGRVAADRLNLLARWLGPRCAVVRSLFAGMDLAALRAVARGVAEGAPATARLRGITPTPLLPAPLLARLAAADSAEALHQVLARARHPAAEALGGASAPGHRGDLLRLELALRSWWAAWVRTGARRAGGEARRVAEAAIDRENLRALILASAWGVEVTAESVFLPGGRVMGAEAFLSLARQADTDLRRTALARAFQGTATGRILRDVGIPLEGVPSRLLAADIVAARRQARVEPLGLAPMMEVVLRIEAEARDLRRILHGMALDAPPSLVAAGLVAA